MILFNLKKIRTQNRKTNIKSTEYTGQTKLYKLLWPNVTLVVYEVDMYSQIKQCLPFCSNSVKMKKSIAVLLYIALIESLKVRKSYPKKHIHWLYRFSALFSFPGSSEVLDSFATMHSLRSLAQWKANTALTGASVSSGLGLRFHGSLWTSALTMFKSFQKTRTQNPKKFFFSAFLFLSLFLCGLFFLFCWLFFFFFFGLVFFFARAGIRGEGADVGARIKEAVLSPSNSKTLL